MILHGQIRTRSDSIFSDQDWTLTKKFHSRSSLLGTSGPPAGDDLIIGCAIDRRYLTPVWCEFLVIIQLVLDGF